ncbi:hypothetical protein PUS82_00370 [Cytobacillus firmus]|uniref:hypothetical protein n=1 Tax=Cytobacillus firmus TaxID=1399 RepID=UPI00237C22AA|nr:hypothetical protein [Cytobacillus firmus]MDD9309785.1 hypothetical protein [Cytobacillus firmus]
MKSRISYERFVTDLKEFTVHKHINGLSDIQECVSYWNPDVAVVDIHSPLYKEAKELFFRFNVDVVEFTSDFQSAAEEVKSYSAFFDSEPEDAIHKKEEPKEIPDFSHYQVQERQEREKEVVVQVKKEIVEIEKEIEVISYTNVPSKLIVMASLWPGTGSSFVSSNLARAIAARGIQVSYVENPLTSPYMFDFLNVSQLEETEKFHYVDISRVIDERGFVPRGKAWSYRGVQWVLNDPRKPSIKSWDFERMLRLIYSINTPIIIVDISTNWMDEEIKGLLHQADMIYVNVEPDPIKISCLTPFKGVSLKEQRKEERFIRYIEEIEKTEGIPFNFIVTKSNSEVDRKELIEYLDKTPAAEIEYIPYPEFMECVWESEFIYDTEKYQDKLDQSFLPIIKDILPPKFHYREEVSKKKREPLWNVFRKKRKEQ